ncbi:MAG: biotin--[acetyl-CoA-carboxylase] ligase [Methylophilaceae bacterium]|nr:biotin--[acetyl-CoA-carboxylase] ligase [Methylophilaceae bacterium]
MNTYTFPVLRLLSDGKFHSGEVIAQRLNVTRTTVWQALQHAAGIGVLVHSVRGRGYKLPAPITLLDELAIFQAMRQMSDEQHAGFENVFKLEVLNEVDSTNSYLMRQTAGAKDTKSVAHATCVAAQVQTKGRGRRGRSWQAGLGASLTFSLLWQFQCGASGLSGLSLAIGVGLIRALHGLGIAEAQLKWPNDVLINGKKLAGILIELQGDIEGPSTAVIGIGINMNLPENLRSAIDQPAIDLYSVAIGGVDPNQLLGHILKHLADVIKDFEQVGFTILRQEWSNYHAYDAKPVRLLMPDGREVKGVVNGVAEDGILLVETTVGLQRFSSGEISLRGAL